MARISEDSRLYEIKNKIHEITKNKTKIYKKDNYIKIDISKLEKEEIVELIIYITENKYNFTYKKKKTINIKIEA